MEEKKKVKLSEVMARREREERNKDSDKRHENKLTWFVIIFGALTFTIGFWPTLVLSFIYFAMAYGYNKFIK